MKKILTLAAALIISLTAYSQDHLDIYVNQAININYLYLEGGSVTYRFMEGGLSITDLRIYISGGQIGNPDQEDWYNVTSTEYTIKVSITPMLGPNYRVRQVFVDVVDAYGNKYYLTVNQNPYPKP